jgi:glycosyltransferase involved in cell wall biosynthesis
VTRVSTVIPAYNRAHTIGRAIESALGQTRPPDEVVVVDDCSKDATREVLAAWHRRDSRVRPVFREKNGGPAGGRNSGVAAARGDLIAFLDSDDVWLPDHLAECAGLLEADPGLDLAFSDVRWMHTSGRTLYPSWLTENKRIGQYLAPHPAGTGWYRFAVPEPAALFLDNIVPIQTSVVRTAAARAYPFDEKLRGPEDYAFALRLARAGKRFGYVDRVQCEYLLHDANLVGNRAGDLRMYGEEVKLWRRVLGDPAARRDERARCHGHLARLWHDQGYILVRQGQPGRAFRAHARSLWHRPSVRAVRGLARASADWLTATGFGEVTR